MKKKKTNIVSAFKTIDPKFLYNTQKQAAPIVLLRLPTFLIFRSRVPFEVHSSRLMFQST